MSTEITITLSFSNLNTVRPIFFFFRLAWIKLRFDGFFFSESDSVSDGIQMELSSSRWIAFRWKFFVLLGWDYGLVIFFSGSYWISDWIRMELSSSSRLAFRQKLFYHAWIGLWLDGIEASNHFPISRTLSSLFAMSLKIFKLFQKYIA